MLKGCTGDVCAHGVYVQTSRCTSKLRVCGEAGGAGRGGVKAAGGAQPQGRAHVAMARGAAPPRAGHSPSTALI